MKKRLSAVIIIIVILLSLLCACDAVWGGDGQSKSPDYHYVPSGETNSGAISSGSIESGAAGADTDNGQDKIYYTFILEFRQPTDKTEISQGDSYPHSTIDGELIQSWEIPMYGNTVYESVVKYFQNKNEKMTFRLSQHRYYMFHEYVDGNGKTYNLETVYIAADGKYANCANFQSVLGDDGIAGTQDDLKVLTLVYKGWLY